MKTIPINTDESGCCRCIKAGYYKMGWTNFTREILGAKDGFTATALIEVYGEDSTDISEDVPGRKDSSSGRSVD